MSSSTKKTTGSSARKTMSQMIAIFEEKENHIIRISANLSRFTDLKYHNDVPIITSRILQPDFKHNYSNAMYDLLYSKDLFVQLQYAHDNDEFYSDVDCGYVLKLLKKDFTYLLGTVDVSHMPKFYHPGNTYPIIHHFVKQCRNFLFDDYVAEDFTIKPNKSMYMNRFMILDDDKNPVCTVCTRPMKINQVVYEHCANYYIRPLRKLRPQIINDLTTLVEEHFAEVEPEPRMHYIRWLKIKIQNVILALKNNIQQGYPTEEIEMLNLASFDRSEEVLESHIVYDSNMDIDCMIQPRTFDIEPQMMENEDEISTVVDKGPVVLTNIGETEQSQVIASAPMLNWINLVNSDIHVDQRLATNMPIIEYFEWFTNSEVNSNVLKMELPNEILKKNPNHPAAMMFKQYAFWSGDIVIRMHVNTTPFHVGKLLMWFYYAAKFDDNLSQRENIYSGIQMNPASFNASSGKDVELRIPFRNYRTSLATRSRSSNSYPLYLGNLYINVYNKLIANNISSVGGYIHIMFENNKFYGILPGISNIEPQMLPINKVAKLAEQGLHMYNKTFNADKPPIITPVNPLVPVVQDSFATGTNDVVFSRSLRLDPAGQTQHPEGTHNNEDEMTIDFIKQKWGAVTTIELSDMDERNAIKWSSDASPEFRDVQLPKVLIKVGQTAIEATVLPPISALCSIHAYFRGEFELMFEFINSRYHTGAVAFSYAPGVKDIDTVTNSYNAIMNIGNQTLYTFTVPYISDKAFAPQFSDYKGYDSHSIETLGCLKLTVLNPLKDVSGTSNKIYINIFVRAKQNFEFMALVAPTYTLFWNNNVPPSIPPVKMVIPSNGGVGSWRYSDNVQVNMNVVRYSSGADQVAQFKNMKPFVVYLCDQTIRQITGVSQCKIDGSNGLSILLGTPNYIAMFIVNNDQDKYTYAVPFGDIETAKRYVDEHVQLSADNNPFPNSPRQTNTIFYNRCADPSEGSYNNSTSNLVWYPVYQARKIQQIEPQMDDIIDLSVMTGNLSVTNNGMYLIGEQYASVKDYLRRYQYLTTITIPNSYRTAYIARIPITPVGLEIEAAAKNTLSREGVSGFVASAYRFYRGGMRYKIMIVEETGKRVDGNFVFQHKPNVVLTSRKVLTNNDNSYNANMQSGYAFDVMSTSVNNTISIEIPAYIPSNLLMLQDPSTSALSEVIHYGLGVLDVYMTSSFAPELKMKMIVYSAIADDMQFNTFVGFPPVVPITSPLDENEDNDYVKIQMSQAMIEPQMDTESIEEQGIYDKTFGRISNAFDNYKKKIINKEIASLADVEVSSEDTLYSIVWAIIKKECKEYSSELINAFFQILQCINNLSISTFVIAIISILVSFGLPCYKYISKFGGWLSNLFTKKIESQGENETGESLEEVKKSFVNAIVSMCCDAGNFVVDKVKNISMPNFSSQIFTNIRLGSLTINGILMLFRNLFTIIPKIFDWLRRYMNPVQWYRSLISSDKDIIMNWCKDVEYILNPHNSLKIENDHRLAFHLELLDVVGRDIMVKIDTASLPKKHNFRYIQDIYRKFLTKYENTILSNFGCGSVGTEPFCLSFVGPSQIGKTYEIESVCLALLKCIGYTTNGNPVYYKPKGQFYTGALNQPIFINDDFLHNKTDQEFSREIDDFITLKSKAVFQPPQAEIERKHIKYSPLIVALTQNEPFPKKVGVLANDYAWMKRRDILVKVEKHSVVWGGCTNANQLPTSVTYDKNHLRYRIYSTVTGVIDEEDKRDAVQDAALFKEVSVPKAFKHDYLEENDVVEDKKVKYIQEFGIAVDDQDLISTNLLTYDQLIWYLKIKFKISYEKSVQDYLRRVKKLQEFLPKADETLRVNIDSYRQYIYENRERHTESTLKQIKKKFRSTRKITF